MAGWPVRPVYQSDQLRTREGYRGALGDLKMWYVEQFQATPSGTASGPSQKGRQRPFRDRQRKPPAGTAHRQHERGAGSEQVNACPVAQPAHDGRPYFWRAAQERYVFFG